MTPEWLSKVWGVTRSFFQIGGSTGPGLANDGGSGNLGAYNATQSGYVNVRGADPVVAHDFVTLEYGNAHYGGSSLNAGSIDVTFQGDEIDGVVTGLSGTPSKVVSQAIFEEGVTVQSGMVYDFIATQFNANGFNWRLKVLQNEYWPVSITLKVDYIWST
jgi:hypothetical protein